MPTVWLAVTGLSRSGKTVFITSLIHNLLSATHNPNRMPLLGVVGERRLIAAKPRRRARRNRLPRFPYFANIEKLAGRVPDWPARTADISETGVEIRFAPADSAGRLLSEFAGSAGDRDDQDRRLPGRVAARPALLGAELRRMVAGDAARCCAGRSAPRSPASSSRSSPSIAPTKRASEEVAKHAHDLYRACLVKARDQHGLSYLQPGRFLCRGSLGEVPYLWFAPLDVAESADILRPQRSGR